MIFTPLTEDELQRASLVEDGVYDYVVIDSKEGISHAGNPKIDVRLKIWDKNGQEKLIFTNMSLMKLLKHFCDMNGLQEQYNQGRIEAAMLMNKSGGQVVIGFDPEKPDGKNGMYPAKNVVRDYVTKINVRPSAMKPLPEKKFIDDDVPF